MYRRYNPNKRNPPTTGCSGPHNSNTSEMCPVCCYNIPSEDREAIFAIGPCNHPICYHCCAKMRILQEKNECAICRNTISEIIFCRDAGSKFSEFNKAQLIRDKDMLYSDQNIKSIIEYLLVERCLICNQTFANFGMLNSHLEKHKKYACDICADNLKIFSSERKYYTSGQLRSHKERGDENSPFNGHPICRFDDMRFMDDDALRDHIKRNHFTCHLCPNSDAFNDFNNLTQHFRSNHYLCEEGNCKYTQYTNVFRNSIDLKAHRARHHCTKSEARLARNISTDLNFVFGRPSASFRSGDSEPEPSNGASGGTHAQQTLPRMSDFPALSSTSSSQYSESNLLPIRSSATYENVASTSSSSFCLSDLRNSRPRALFAHHVGSCGIGRTSDAEFPALCSNSSQPSVPLSDGFAKAAKKEVDSKKDHTQASTSRRDAPSQALGVNGEKLSFCSDDFPALPVKINRKKAKHPVIASTMGNNSVGTKSGNIINTAAKANANATAMPRDDTSGLVSLAVVANLLEKSVQQQDNTRPEQSSSSVEPSPHKAKSRVKQSQNQQTHPQTSANQPQTTQRRIPPPPGYEDLEPPLSALEDQIISMSLENEKHDAPNRSDSNMRSDGDRGYNQGAARDKRRHGRDDIGKKCTNLDDSVRDSGARSRKRNVKNGLSEKTSDASGASFSNSTGEQSGPIHTYIEPDNYKRLKSDLDVKLEFLLKESRFQSYEEHMSAYLSGRLPAERFYILLTGLFYHRDLKERFPEIVALIPDIKKQKDLVSAYMKNRTCYNSVKNEPKKTGVWKLNDLNTMDFRTCPVCSQVLLKEHAIKHTRQHE